MISILQEIASINRDRKGLFDGQAELCLPNESDLRTVDAILTPNSGPFKDGKIVFRLTIPPAFPRSSPTAVCLTRIFHPNVSTAGSVCFNMFGSDGWTDKYTLEFFVVGLLWLLNNPNPASCLNSAAAIHDMNQFTQMVQLSMCGIAVKGATFDTIMQAKRDPMFVELSTWLAMGQSTARSELWYCPGAEPLVAIMKELKTLGFDTATSANTSWPLYLLASGAQVPLYVVDGVLVRELSLVDLSRLPVEQTVFSCAKAEVEYLPLVRKLQAAGVKLASKSESFCSLHFGSHVANGIIYPDYIEVDLRSLSVLPDLTPLVVPKPADARYVPLVRKLQSFGAIILTSYSENSDNLTCTLAGTSVSGALSADGIFQLNYASGKELRSRQANPFNACPFVKCDLTERVDKCTAALAPHAPISAVLVNADGSIQAQAAYQGLLFFCQVLLEENTVDLPFNLYRRLLASKVDCSALVSSSYSAVEGILEEISAAGQLIDVTPAGPSCWNLRFTGEGIGRYIVEKREVELSMSSWQLLGQPGGIFTVPNQRIREKLTGLTVLNTNLSNTAQIHRLGREVEGKQEVMFAVSPNRIPLHLAALSGGSPAWSVHRNASLGELLSSSEPIIIDPLLFALPSFFQVEERLCAKGEPDATANFFVEIAKSREVRLESLHLEIPPSSNYYFCPPTASLPELAPLIKASA